MTYNFFSDRWRFGRAGTSAFNANTVSGYLEIDVTTADGSIAAGDIAYMMHSIEGFNTSDLLIGTASAKTITFSFKHKHTKTGIYCVSFHNSANDRNYIFEYTQSVSNTEETHAETVTLDTTGTWIGATNGIGLKITFCFGSGSTYQGSADTWQAGNLLATSNQVNGMDSASNYFRITDVQLEVGTVATPLEYEHYEVTFAKCERYYQYHPSVLISGYNVSSGTYYIDFPYPTQMRANPTGTLVLVVNSNSSTATVNVAGTSHIRLGGVVTSTGSAFSGVNVALTADL